MVKLPPLAPRTPEQRVEARLQRVVREPRGASRGGGVLLRSELAGQNEARVLGRARAGRALVSAPSTPSSKPEIEVDMPPRISCRCRAAPMPSRCFAAAFAFARISVAAAKASAVSTART